MPRASTCHLSLFQIHYAQVEGAQGCDQSRRLTDLKFLLSKTFDFYSEKLINAAFIGKHEILRALLHGSHEFINFSHVLANDDAIIEIHENHNASKEENA